MKDEFNYSLLHSDLSSLENLRKFTLESKLLASQQFASRIMNGSEVDMNLAYQENIMPWELEIFAAYSVIFNGDDATQNIDMKSFAEAITYIRNYWDQAFKDAEQTGTYPEAFMIRSIIQQFSVQGPMLQKLFRYNYFFNFQNDILDMKKEFNDKFSTEYFDFEFTAFALFLLLSKASLGKIHPTLHQQALCRIFENETVISTLCIDKEKYIVEMKNLYKDDILKLYYGLKAHQWWPLVEGNDGIIYIPSPYLVINAVTESMLNRLTFRNDKLRKLIGKEVLENYLFDIYKQVETVTWISPEIEYWIGKKLHKTPDVLVAENEYCCFYDTKEMVPSLKIRELDEEEIEKDSEIYAMAIRQSYNQIVNYTNGFFELDKKYDKEKIFGVVVMLEDIGLSRDRIYSLAFDLIAEEHGDIGDGEKRFIQSHIKIVSLRQIEAMVLQNTSFLPCLIKQESHPEEWMNQNFAHPTTENGLIPSYAEYCENLKRRFYQFVKNI